MGAVELDVGADGDRLVGHNSNRDQERVIVRPNPRSDLIGDDQGVLGRDGYGIVSRLARIGNWRIAARNDRAGQVRPIFCKEVRSHVGGVCRGSVEDINLST